MRLHKIEVCDIFYHLLLIASVVSVVIELTGNFSPEEVFRMHYADLSCLVSDSNNKLPVANELFSARRITLDCYNSATDNAAKLKWRKVSY